LPTSNENQARMKNIADTIPEPSIRRMIMTTRMSMMTTGIVKNKNNPWWQKRKEKEQGFARAVPLKMIPFLRSKFS
jgi:hypothetical protein